MRTVLIIVALVFYSTSVYAGLGNCACVGNCNISISGIGVSTCQAETLNDYNDIFNTSCTCSNYIDTITVLGDGSIREFWRCPNTNGPPTCDHPTGGHNYNFTRCANPAENYPSCTQQEYVKVKKNKGQPNDGVCPAGNPIHPATGNKFQQETILSLAENSFNFSLYYNSIDEDIEGNQTIKGQWSSSYKQYIEIFGSFIRVNRADQKVLEFNCLTNGVCDSDPDSKISFEKITSGFTLLTEDNVTEQYDTAGKLLSITPLSGETQTLSYNATTNLLETVTDSYGRALNFTYDANNRLETVTDPVNSIYTFTYDALDNLTSVVYPDTATRQYQYNDPNFDSLLTAIIDENGNTYASFGYDAQGRAIFSEHSGGAERVDLVYNTDGTTTVTDSAGASNTFTFDVVSFVPKP